MPGSKSFALEAALRHGPWIALFASLAVTPVGYALVALALERRILRPASEFVAVSCGDPLLAVAIALGVWLFDGRPPAGIASPAVGAVNLAIWLGFGLWQGRDETPKGFHTCDPAVAPTKIWAPVVVYPALRYWTWGGLVGRPPAPAARTAA